MAKPDENQYTGARTKDQYTGNLTQESNTPITADVIMNKADVIMNKVNAKFTGLIGELSQLPECEKLAVVTNTNTNEKNCGYDDDDEVAVQQLKEKITQVKNVIGNINKASASKFELDEKGSITTRATAKNVIAHMFYNDLGVPSEDQQVEYHESYEEAQEIYHDHPFHESEHSEEIRYQHSKILLAKAIEHDIPDFLKKELLNDIENIKEVLTNIYPESKKEINDLFNQYRLRNRDIFKKVSSVVHDERFQPKMRGELPTILETLRKDISQLVQELERKSAAKSKTSSGVFFKTSKEGVVDLNTNNNNNNNNNDNSPKPGSKSI